MLAPGTLLYLVEEPACDLGCKTVVAVYDDPELAGHHAAEIGGELRSIRVQAPPGACGCASDRSRRGCSKVEGCGLPFGHRGGHWEGA